MSISKNAPSYSASVGEADYGQIRTTGAGFLLKAANGVLRFETSNGSSTTSERARIDKDGNLGIGTSSPVEKLHIANGDIYIEDVSSGVIMKSPDGNCWRLTVDNSGSPVFTSITCPN